MTAGASTNAGVTGSAASAATRIGIGIGIGIGAGLVRASGDPLALVA